MMIVTPNLMAEIAADWRDWKVQVPDAPEGAKYGIFNVEKEAWTGEWFLTILEAQDAADGISRSGFSLVVMSLDDEEVLEPSGF